jgi:PHS family inorganic phosphate transporter-like MFS transporter
MNPSLSNDSDPLSAVITAEFSSTKYRGGIIAAVFAMQGLGQLAAALVTLIVVVVYKVHLISIASVADCSGECAMTVDKMWRIVIAFGVRSLLSSHNSGNAAIHFRCFVRC